VWVADITYIRLAMEFVFLAVILDAYSRRVVGWELSRSLRTEELTLPALERALGWRPVPDGLIHHSDQGVQYAAKAYVSRAQEAGLLLSMGRRGHPEDNARAEAFFRTLKVEQVYLTEYLDFADAQRQIEAFIEEVYNRKRLHSSLGYVPPVEFEETLEAEAKRSAPVGGSSAPLTAVAGSRCAVERPEPSPTKIDPTRGMENGVHTLGGLLAAQLRLVPLRCLEGVGEAAVGSVEEAGGLLAVHAEGRHDDGGLDAAVGGFERRGGLRLTDAGGEAYDAFGAFDELGAAGAQVHHQVAADAAELDHGGGAEHVEDELLGGAGFHAG
jgi:hypothetical protein